MAANLGTRWGMSLRFILSGTITLISQWTIMLNLIVIEVRIWSCCDVISASSDTAGGGHNLLNGPFHKFCTFGFTQGRSASSHSHFCSCAVGAEPAQHTLSERPPIMDGTFRLLASCLLLVVLPGAEGTSSRQRVYYIGIVEGNWDYAPSGKNLLNGKDIADDQ